jgi:hypothetical protein
MSNRRMITSNLFVDTFIGHLNLLERMLWIGLISTAADDQGRMLDSTILLRAQIFLFDLEVTDAQVESGLAKLARAKKITRYTAEDGTRLIQIVKWWRHQTPSWASPSIYPAPAEWQDRVKCHVGGNKVVTFEWDGPGGYIPDYAGRYVAENAVDYVPNYVENYVPAVGSPIDEDDIKDKNESEDEDEDEVRGPLGVKAPGAGNAPAWPGPASSSSSSSRVPLLKGAPENQIGRDVVCKLAHWPAIPCILIAEIESNLTLLLARYPKKEDLLNYCRRFAEEYYRRYPARTSAGWLDWAVMGNIPEQRARNRPGFRENRGSEIVRPQCKGNTVSAEEILAALDAVK